MKSVRASVFFLLAALTSLAAGAADYKVLIDVDNKAATGCSVATTGGTFAGVEEILTTTVDTVNGVQRVIGVSGQRCVDGAFAAPVSVDSTGWAVGTDNSGKSIIETHVPVTELGVTAVQNARVAFVGTSAALGDVILSRLNGSPILFPQTGQPRRRAAGETRDIVMDGDLSDWGMIAPLVDGNASTGSSSFHFGNILGYAGEGQLYFAFDVRTNRNAPIAVEDNYFVLIGKALNVGIPGVLSNDISPSGAPLTAVVIAGPQHGTLTLNPNGSFNYLHDGSDAPQDSFQYKVNDGKADSNAAQVRIDITKNSPPVAHADAYAVAHRGTLTVPAKGVLANDSDADGDPLRAVLATNPLRGTLTLNLDGSFTYTHDGSNTLTDSFTYRAADSFGSSNPTTVTITIAPDIPPVAIGETYGVLEGGTLTVPAPTLFANDTDVDTPSTFWSANVVAQPAHGTLTLLPGGGFTYVNDSVTGASDSFTYRVNDGIFNSNTVTVTLNVTPVNDAPVFTIGGPVTALDTGGAQSIPVIVSSNGGATDEAGQTINYIVSNDNNALFSVQPAISNAGVLTFTPVVGQSGVANITIIAHDNGGTANGGVDTSAPQILPASIEKIPAITSANTTTFVVSQLGTFTVTTTGLPQPSINEAGALPAGVTFVDGTGVNKGKGVLSGTPAPGTGGSYPITFQATNTHGSSPIQNFTLIVNQPPAITSANVATFTRNQAGTFTITTTGFPVATMSETGALPAGLNFVDNGNGTATLSGTPTAAGGTYAIVVNATNGVGSTAQQTLTITINQTPAITSGNATNFQAGTPSNFTVTTTGFPAPSLGETGALPAGITFVDNGNGTATLGGNAAQGSGGVYTITITATNVAGNAPQSFTITVCNIIAVTAPGVTTATAGSAFSQNFTQTGAVGTATFATASTLPAGMTLATTGTLSGTPTQVGTFPIVVTVTDSNGCVGTSGTYNLNVACPTISVTNPVNANGTANAAFNETFTQTGSIGTATFSLATGTLPAGLSLAANGVLSGTPTQTGSFPITVKVTDSNGCTGTSGTYTINIACQVITVTKPVNSNGTANAAFNETFTQSGSIGTPVFTLASGTLPAGLTLASNGVLSGTPVQTGSFPITVKVTDANGCTGTSATYTISIACQTISVTVPVVGSGTANAAFSQTFTQTGGIGTVTFTLASGTLPAGLTLASNGVLSGTPTQTGGFSITVTATDANGCTGTSGGYDFNIGCQTITVTKPGVTTGTISAAFSQQFTQTGGIGTVTFTTADSLPAGISLASNGTLAGIPTQTGSFPITVTATDANGCTGTSALYTLVINCQVITVTNPVNATGAAGSPFSETFTQSGAIGGATFTLASGTLPSGLSLASNGVLSGTPMQGGSFPITVMVTDGNGCVGTGSTYTIVITCPVITVTNPANANGTAGSAFSEMFTSAGGVGTVTYSVTGTLPAGITLNTATGVLSGTTTQVGAFPITVTATDQNGCTGTGSTYNLNIACQTITVTSPVNANGTVDAAFSETFNATGILGTATWSIASGTLPAGLSLNSTTGVLSGTPTVPGSFPITVKATDTNGCFGVSSTYTISIACQTITVTKPVTATGTVDAAFSQTFTQTGAHGTATFTTASTLPAGLTLSAAGVLSGTPTVSGSFPITVTVTDSNGCTGTSASYALVIGCQTITVTNPGPATPTANQAFSVTFTQSGAHATATFTTASTLPAGVTLSTSGVLSGTPTQTGTFPIVVTVTDANGCTGTGTTYNLVVGCQTITVTKPVVTTGTISTAFSQQFTQTGGIGTVTFTTADPLPAGITLATNGTLAGIPTQTGSFPITVTATDANGCTGVSALYTLVINCQVITVTNPATTSGAAGSPFSVTFTQSGAQGGATFTVASGTLPTGLTLASNGVLSGTPTQGGSFPITVMVTDGNSCTGTGSTYNLTITCPVITVTNPGNPNAVAGTAYSQTFTSAGGVGTVTYSVTGTLPAGITLNSATGVLSGTTTQVGSFPITVTATDQNGCTGTGSTFNLSVACQTVSVTNPVNANGTVDAAFSETFNATGILGTATWSIASGTLPAGLTLNSTTGVLSGTPTVPGSFPITVKATDTNGCFGVSSTYTISIACQTITVTKPVNASGTVDAAFSQTFTQTGAHGTATFTTASTLPAGLTLSAAGVLSGTPTVTGSFPITVTVTDSNGCTGTSASYPLVIGCQTISVSNPGVTSGTASAAFSQTFTQTGAHGTATFTTASTLPAGLTLSTSGVLSGTPTQTGTFPIVVTVTDSNGCTGSGSTYTLIIGCQTITVAIPATNTGTVAAPFSQSFTVTGAIGGFTCTTASTLPTGLTLSTGCVLSGTPTQSGSFPIVVTATDSNGCTGTSSAYNLSIACNVISVTNPVNSNGTAGSAFNETFTQTGGNGTIVWSVIGTLPAGISINSATGVLSGTTTATGSFPITVKATDGNGCTGTGSTYTINIGCQTVTVTNPGVATTQAGVAFSQTFTATGILGTATWSVSGTLPTGITLNTSTGNLSGTTNQIGSYPITVTATDSNGCFGTGSTYTLVVTCPTITVSRTGGGSFPQGTISTAYTGQSVTATGGGGTYTFAVSAGSLPTGLSLASNGTLSGTPTATGTYNFTVTATDTVSLCTGSQALSIQIKPAAGADSYSNLVFNTQALVTGGTSTSTANRARFPLTGVITANDAPAGSITLTTGTFATTNGGSVTIAADGTFVYTPPVASAASPTATDTFTYTITSDSGSTGTPVAATGTVTLNFTNRVWYVDNTNAGTADGRSDTPFATLAAAQAASFANDYIYVYTGSGSTGMNAGITLKNNQILNGQGASLVVNSQVLKGGTGNGTGPTITNTGVNGDAVTLADGNLVRGCIISGATRDGISGNGKAGATFDFLTVLNNGGAGLHLVNMTGTIGSTNSTWNDKTATPASLAIDLSGGTAAITMDVSNVFTSAAGRTLSIASRTGGTVTIGADINDSGSGILVSNNTGGTITISGVMNLNTNGNTAVALTNNTGATITFGGTLGITTTTGSGFVASGGGTLNVGGTPTITVGAATAGLSLNGMTIGGSGVTFNTVNATGATTGISLVNVAGLVTVNGGTINNAGTGITMQGSSTNLTIANVTIGGTTTTGITNTTNFGTLTIGANVSVTGVTALNLNTGAVSGTFVNVNSTGGTNGVNLNAVTGTWGCTCSASTLTGASGAEFNVTGGSGGTIAWGGAISQANAATVVTIGGSNSNTINFTGNLSSTGTSTGLLISGSSGTYSFSGTTNTFSGAGGIVIGNGTTESGSITFGSGTSITTAGTAFQVNGGAAALVVTANITYSGTINKTTSGTVLNITNYATGTLTMNGTSIVGNVGNPTGVISTLSNVTGTVVINNLSETSSNNGFTNTLLAISGTNTGGSFTFNHLTLSATGTGPNKGLTASGGGALTITATGGASSIAVTGPALDLSGVTLGTSAIGTLTSTGGANGIKLTNVTGNALTIGGGSISGNTAAAFLVSGGSPSVSFAGPITQNTANVRAVDLQSRTGGTITFGGLITSTGGAAGVFLNSNAGSTTNFNGGLTLSTAGNPAFTATTSGTVEIIGTNNFTSTTGKGLDWSSTTSTNGITINNVTSTTGAAVSIVSSGASNFTFNDVTSTTGTAVTVTTATGAFSFHAINANGAATGIAVTGATGSFIVNGTGSTSGSGGTIQNCTAKGADFRTSSNVTLKNMAFTNNATANGGAAATCGDALNALNGPTNCNSNISLLTITTAVLNNVSATGSKQIGIDVNGGSNLTLTNVTATGNGNEVAEDGVQIANLTGALVVTGGTYKDNAANEFEVQNGANTLTVTVTGSTFSNTSLPTGATTPSNATANSGLFLATHGTATMNPTITGCTVDRIYAQGIRIDLANTSTMTVNIGPATGAGGGNTLTNNNQAVAITGSNTGGITYNIRNNTINVSPAVNAGASTNQVGVSKSASGGTWTGLIENNIIGNATTNSGCEIAGCNSIAISNNNSAGSHKLQIKSNTIQHPEGSGISILSGGGSDNSSNSWIVQGNNISNPDQGATAANPAILMQSGSTAATDTTNTCADISGNTITGTWSLGTSHLSSIRVRSLSTVAGSFSLVGFNPATDYPDSAGAPAGTTGGVGTVGNVADYIRSVNPSVSNAPPGQNGASANLGASSPAFSNSGGCP